MCGHVHVNRREEQYCYCGSCFYKIINKVAVMRIEILTCTINEIHVVFGAVNIVLNVVVSVAVVCVV